MPGLVTVAAYDDLSFAYMAKARLEAEGIPCFLANEYLVGVQWLYSNAVGGIKVQVPEDVAEEAFALLAGEPDGAEAFSGSEAPDEDTEHFADNGMPDGLSASPSGGGPSSAGSGVPVTLSEDGDGALSCPECGSTDIERRDYGKAFAAFGFLSGLPLPFRFRRSRCGRCGHTWK